jgi:hypothetical protein
MGSEVTTDTLDTYATQIVPAIILPIRSELIVNATFQIDTGGTPVGYHKLRAALAIQSGKGNYVFGDSVEYQMLDYLENMNLEYPILQYVYTPLVSAIISIAVGTTVAILSRRSQKTHESQKPRRKPIAKQ